MTIKNILLLILYGSIILTSVSSANTAADPSLNYYGARPSGMGNAFTPVSDDMNAAFTNPAGLSYVKNWGWTATSTTLLTEINYNSFAVARKFSFGTLGLGFVGENVSGSLGTMRDPSNSGRIVIDPSSEATGYDDNAAIISYANKFECAGLLSLGANLKFLNRSLSGSSEYSSRSLSESMDIGALYTPQTIPWTTFGIDWQNCIAYSAQDSSGGYIKLGVAGKILGTGGFGTFGGNDLLICMDACLPQSVLSSSGTEMHLGAEWKPIQQVAIRAGYDGGTVPSMTYGIGLESAGFRFDYAFRGADVAEGDSNIFSLSYSAELEKPKIKAEAPSNPVPLKIDAISKQKKAY